MTEHVHPHDPVHHPHHYTEHGSGVEVIRYTRLLPFGPGNAIKYVMRRNHKGNPIQDIDKAIWYLNDSIDNSTTYKITQQMMGLALRVMDSEPNYLVASILNALLMPRPNESYFRRHLPDLELARDLCIELREEYL